MSDITWNSVCLRILLGKDVDIMSKIKPIQATPELSGKDAEEILAQVNKKPSKKTIKRNIILSNILSDICKQ